MRGTAHQDKVAQYLYNSNEYLESVFACFKAGLVPVNTNYRYTDDELAYLWDNSDTVAVMFHGTFADRVESVRERVPDVRVLALGRRRHRPLPFMGHSLRGRSAPRSAPGLTRPGVAPARTSTCSTPGGRRGCRRG